MKASPFPLFPLRFHPEGVTGNTLILLVALFLAVFGNQAFFANALKTYPLATGNVFALLSLAVMLFAATVLLLALLCFGRTAKPVLIGFLLLSALAAYFMDSFGIVIDDAMLQNVLQTDVAEARDLLNLKLLAYLGVLGIAPAIAIGKMPLRWRGWRVEVLARFKLLAITLLAMVVIVLAFGSFYASFVREHKPLRTYANPTYYLYSVVKYVNSLLACDTDKTLAAVGTDAHIPAYDDDRELIVLVVGETARADRFSLNGYGRDTNPLLRERAAVSFDNFRSCGTSTAVSVPCMFSLAGMDRFDGKQAAVQENLLDVLQHAGVNVLWLDNNSDSKGVALRVPYRNYKSPDVNPVCDAECRDEGMLAPLQAYIDAHPHGDIFIVLHQMGNHGPAYFKRYPPAFEKFTPACQSADLSQCSQAEIDNAYDNAILYTDYFLAKAIDLLKQNDEKFETALFYVSDHGESLGEAGTYLHGLPRAIAPDVQVHVPAVMWLGRGFGKLDRDALRAKRTERFTHDNLFHTILGFMEIETAVYRSTLDILDGCRKPGPE